MSRRKQSNPKPVKVDEKEEIIEESLCFEESTAEESKESESKKNNANKISPSKQSQGVSDVPDELNSSYECPVCDKALESQHDFTIHIRLHNSGDPTTTMHTCGLCGKTLSSSSSLDRHMLVHSGERPFKCSQCNMAFTTNGNMHRHMRTHHGEGSDANEEEKSSRSTPVKRPASPRSIDDQPPCKIIDIENDVGVEDFEDKVPPPSLVKTPPETAMDQEDEQLHCPVCNKTFLCKYGLQTHLDTHPNILKCQDCNLIFRNFRGLNRHRYHAHIKKANEKNSKNVTVGFQDLTFLDFSSEKFAIVAKAVCEQNIRCPSSVFHSFECSRCKKAFPCGSALKLHNKTKHCEENLCCTKCDLIFTDAKQLNRHQFDCRTNDKYLSRDNGSVNSQVPTSNKENFFAVLGLQASKLLHPVPRMPEEPYENPAYFTHGMPSSKIIEQTGLPLRSSFINDNEDFADIQSILSLTSAPCLLSTMGNPPVGVKSASPRRGLNINPESPATADSATASPELPADSEHAAVSPSTISNTNKARFPCKLCSLVFPNLRALKGHNRSHLGMSPYRCNMCPYTSIDKSTLLRHLRTHNGERPYLCTLCQYAFTTKANCERHMRKRHGKLNKQEIRNAMQLIPQQAHDSMQPLNGLCISDTMCKYCNVDFKYFRVLRQHLRSLHSSCSRKPFQCRLCHMGFSTRNNCYRHILKQHPEKKDEVDDLIWSFVTESGMDIDDQSTLNSDDAPDMSDNSMSPGPPLLDPVPPITDVNMSDSDLSSVEVLVNWSARSLADVPLQEEPLDLAVHPMDLSVKRTESSNIAESIIKSALPSRPQPMMPTCNPLPPPPPPLVMQSSPFLSKRINPFSNHSNPRTPPLLTRTPPEESLNPDVDLNTSAPSDNSLPIPSPIILNPILLQQDLPANLFPKNLVKTDNGPEILLKKQKQKRYRTERPFKCNHCEAGFTLRSNMERHIKQQHPEHWEARIRGRKPSSSVGVVPSRPLLPRATDASPRPISNHVKEAISQQIRQRLAVTVQEEESIVQNGLSVSADVEISLDATEKPSKLENCDIQEQAQDLVSVSKLLDTANAQKIQEIFREPENGPGAYIANGSTSNEKQDTKRSAYTNAPHRVSCPYCSRRFPWTSSLRRHILTHTGQKPFKCPHCPLLFTTKSNCDRHLVRKHGGATGGDQDVKLAPERPYRCNLCPNSAFSTPSNLRKHYQQKHDQRDESIPWDELLEPINSANSASESENNEDDPGLSDSQHLPNGSNSSADENSCNSFHQSSEEGHSTGDYCNGESENEDGRLNRC